MVAVTGSLVLAIGAIPLVNILLRLIQGIFPSSIFDGNFYNQRTVRTLPTSSGLNLQYSDYTMGVDHAKTINEWIQENPRAFIHELNNEWKLYSDKQKRRREDEFQTRDSRHHFGENIDHIDEYGVVYHGLPSWYPYINPKNWYRYCTYATDSQGNTHVFWDVIPYKSLENKKTILHDFNDQIYYEHSSDSIFEKITNPFSFHTHINNIIDISTMFTPKRKRKLVPLKIRGGQITKKRKTPIGYRVSGFIKPGGKTPEIKYKDIASATYVMDTTGDLTLLNDIAQGTDYDELLGLKATMRSIKITGFINFNTPASGASQLCRIIIVYDKSSNGNAPTVSNILVASTSISEKNLFNRERFITLLDQVYALDKRDGTQDRVIPVSIYRDVTKMGLVLQKKAGAGGIGNITSGAIYMLTIGSAGAGVTAGQITCTTRVRFVDY